MLLESMLIASYALNVRNCFVYIRGEFDLPYRRLAGAAEEAYAAGYFGERILGSGFSCDIVVYRGAGSYVCGEASALITSIEGRKGYPRNRPPRLTVRGLYQRPTVINNVETLSNVAIIMRMGAEEFRKVGVGKSTGTQLVSISGHVNKPGVYEVEYGYPLAKFIYEDCGGGRRAKAVIPGGISMGLMTESELDTPLDFAGPGKVGCLGLGTAAVVVIDDQTSIVDFLHNSARFFAHESCGQCTPCREGTSWSLRILERIKAGKGRLKDLDILLELGNTMGMMPGSTICGLADGAAWPMKNAIKKFRGEFEDYIKRTNPSGWMVTDPVPALQIVGAH